MPTVPNPDADRRAYVSHHYVPQWYQRRFLETTTNQNTLNVLSLLPKVLRDSRGRQHTLPAQRRRPISKCFAADDLYTLQFGSARSTAIEQWLFGEIDRRGAHAVAYWANFTHPSVDTAALRGLLNYMSSQKLRTPKGLAWLAQEFQTSSVNATLATMVELRRRFESIWCECVWQIADAAASPTKFILTDHPVTVYNRGLGPRNRQCRPPNDPDIRLHGSHTLFPLGLDKLLILTNLSWARNPYRRPTQFRPNPAYYRDSYFNFFEVHTGRSLTEHEVRQINFILKSRAYTCIAAAQAEWLYPEEHVSKSDWNTFGNGHLLMPDPRGLHSAAQIVMEYASGATLAYDDYGRRPEDPAFGLDDQPLHGPTSLQTFQAEFEDAFGPDRRGRPYEA